MDKTKISKIKKSLFKNLVKRNYRTATLSSLKKTKQTHSKVDTIKYPNYKIQPYLQCPTLTFEKTSTEDPGASTACDIQPQPKLQLHQD